jgi:hypothetical protein
LYVFVGIEYLRQKVFDVETRKMSDQEKFQVYPASEFQYHVPNSQGFQVTKGSARGISLLKFKIYTKGCAWMEHPTVDRTGFLRTTSEVPFWYET